MGNPENQRQPFDHRGLFVTRREFTFLGKKFAPGDEFPARRMAVDHRRLRNLFEAKYLDMKSRDVPEEEVVTQDTDDAPAGDLVAGEGEFLFDPAIHAVEKDGDEDWIADEEALLVHITKAAAARLKKSEGKVIVAAKEIKEWPEAAPADEENSDDADESDDEDSDDDEDEKN